MSKIVIGVFVGSLRKQSFTKKIASFVSNLMPANFELKMIEIGQLAMFNQDYDDEGKTPREWTEFRGQVKELDGFLFATPEYNRSVPPVLKNALDIASRPYGQNLWSGKPGAIISVSPGKISGFGANHHLRQSMSFLNIFMLQQPEAYVGNVDTMLDAQGNVADEASKAFLQSFADAFAQWVQLFRDKK